MISNRKLFIFITASLLFSLSDAKELTNPERMMVVPLKKDNGFLPTIYEQRVMISKNYTAAYERVGKPKIAVFWNRKFNDRLSDWEATRRNIQNEEVSVKVKDKLESKVVNDSSYQRNIVGSKKIVSAQYDLYKIKEQHRDGFNETNLFEFSSGYLEPFLMNKTKVIDRQTIMRLVERENSKHAGIELRSDSQKIETDALIGYADYFIEIILTADQKGDAYWSFLVTIKSVSDGQVVAMFKSLGHKPMEPNAKAAWKGTATGFKKIQPKRFIGTPKDVGIQLAYETMNKLASGW